MSNETRLGAVVDIQIGRVKETIESGCKPGGRYAIGNMESYELVNRVYKGIR